MWAAGRRVGGVGRGGGAGDALQLLAGADGTLEDFEAALIAAGKTPAVARRRTTCQVFSTDPVDVPGYTRLGETIVPVKN